ncbi:MAG: class I SAM-dependent methyltransferase [Butyrivibrio sp.]|nr:class I SAM-dependent methyltransferase [Butyrivibrio sp.]
MDNRSFDSKRIAMGYAKRPWLHKQVIEQLKRDLGLSKDHTFKNGLDVGCGAGLSTKALRLVCDKVTGTDIADSMIEVCRELYGQDSAYLFYVAKAEDTKTPAEKYDIVTAAGCINWVDEKKFMANMTEVMEDNGLIVIYDFGITDRLAESEKEATGAYINWYNNAYLNKFPKPPRKENKWTQADLPMGFTMEKQTEYDMEYTFSLEDFADFMMIQSNVNARIESGEMTGKEVRDWMLKSLLPVFESEKSERHFIFSGYSWYIRKR